MAPKLYLTEMSPPSRGVMLTAAALGIQLEYIHINFLEKEHLKPEFVKINPQHTVPTYQDGDFIVWDSHAINAYLATVYGEEDTLLPKDPKRRAIVDQRLQFDAYLFEGLRKALTPLWCNNVTSIPENIQKELLDGYAFTEKFLEGGEWIAGDKLTIADLSLIATISTLDEFLRIDRKRFPRIGAWIKKLEELPYYELNNARGARGLGEIVRSKLI